MISVNVKSICDVGNRQSQNLAQKCEAKQIACSLSFGKHYRIKSSFRKSSNQLLE